MSNQDKAVTALVRSMKKALAGQHGIDVPHSALRASYLQAQGENPHAFAGKAGGTREAELQAEVARLTALVQKAPNFFAPQYDFDGEKETWLRAAGFLDQPKAEVQRSGRTLYLAYDEDGCTSLMALDAEGNYVLPDDFQFAEGSVVTSQHAEVPSVRRYGLPEYLANPGNFYKAFGLGLSQGYTAGHDDLGDDSGDSCVVELSMSDAQWERVLLAVLYGDTSFKDDVSEWVGLHYRHNFDAMNVADQLDWVERYLESLADEASPNALHFEWVYPDEDGDHCDASVDLTTGVVTLQGTVPADISDSSVRTRLNHEAWAEPVDVYFQRNDAGGVWKLKKKDLAEVRKLMA